MAKRFDLEAFEGWAAKHFDFMVFVTSSQRGLPTLIAKTLSAFDQRHQGRVQWFKVFNVFGGQYRGTAIELEPSIRKKFEQAQERSRKYNLTNPDQWILIDSQSGTGVSTLIQSFAEALPLDVLRSLTQVVKERYAPLIEEKISAYFFDYTAHVAALIAVFPVDHAEQGERFLKFALNSLGTMARFMFARPGQVLVSTIVNDMVDELEFSKRRAVYSDEVIKRKKENLLLNIADKVGKQVNPDFDVYNEFNAYQTERKRVAQETYFAVGGVDAIQLILGLSLTLQMLHHQIDPSSLSADHLGGLLEANRRVVEANLGFNARAHIIKVTRGARERRSREEKLRMAAELYPHIRALLTRDE